jgi:uncharacterized protein YjbI with pentapeptide repeats
VNLEAATLSGTYLLAANFKGANLLRADLTQEQLERTRGDENTRLPSNLKSPAHWGVKTVERTEGELAPSRTSENSA